MKFYPVRVVEQSVAEGIGDGGVAHLVVPFAHGQLAREDCGSVAVAIFHDFEKVETISFAERREPQASRIKMSIRASFASHRG